MRNCMLYRSHKFHLRILRTLLLASVRLTKTYYRDVVHVIFGGSPARNSITFSKIVQIVHSLVKMCQIDSSILPDNFVEIG